MFKLLERTSLVGVDNFQGNVLWFGRCKRRPKKFDFKVRLSFLGATRALVLLDTNILLVTNLLARL